MLSKTEYTERDGLGLAELVKGGEVSALELLESVIGVIETYNPSLNAVVAKAFDQAKSAAERGLPDGPFRGVPFLMKDLGEMVAGLKMTSGSRALANFYAPTDSELTSRFRRAGVNIVGKSNTPEFGLLPTTESRLLGACHNPWDVTRSPGGSSGGAAAAVAARLVPIAHASDGGGSIRIPASCCGVFGLKPTRGRTPQGPFRGDSMNGLTISNTVSVSVRDSAAMLDAIAGPDIGDPYVAPPVERPYLQEVQRDPGQLRIAMLLKPFSGTPIAPDVLAAIEDSAALCESLGHAVEPLMEIPNFDIQQFIEAFTVVWASGCGWAIKGIEYLTKRPADPAMYEPLTWQMYRMSLALSPGDYLLAVQGLQQLARRVAHFAEPFDAILTPVTADVSPKLGHFEGTAANPMIGFQNAILYVPFTPIANVTGQPAMSVPLFWNESGLPIGSHFIGKFGEEATLFRLAGQLERERPWQNRVPFGLGE